MMGEAGDFWRPDVEWNIREICYGGYSLLCAKYIKQSAFPLIMSRVVKFPQINGNTKLSFEVTL
jgi:hypothetical protein